VIVNIWIDRNLWAQAKTLYLRAHPGHEVALVEWGGEMTQTGWSAFPGKNEFGKSHQIREKVNWIVQRSYPQVDLTQIASAAGVAAKFSVT